MRAAFLVVLVIAALASAEIAAETSVLSNLENVEQLINAEGLAAVQAKAASEMQAMTAEQRTQLLSMASELVAQGDDRKKDDKKDEKKKKDHGVRVSFKWTNIDVRNFLTWIVSQNEKFGKLEDISLGNNGKDGKKGKKQDKLTEEELKLLKFWVDLRSLDTAGQHGGYWFYRVRVSGTMQSDSIYNACNKYGLKPACNLGGWNDGRCQDTQYSSGRHMSYPGHNLEDWQYWFNSGLYFYTASANGPWPLQNIWGTHQWTYWGHENRWTLCTTNKDPEWTKWLAMHKRYYGIHKKRYEWVEARYKTLTKLRDTESMGEHRGMHWFKVPFSGSSVSDNLLRACLAYDMMPSCSYHGYQNGDCIDSPFDWGRYISYPPHNIEGWQGNNNGIYFHSGTAYYSYSLRNWGGSHYWAGDNGGYTMCVSFRDPFEHWSYYHSFN